MPPTNVEITKPAVMEIMPALVKSVEREKLNIPKITKVITTTATNSERN